MSPINIDRLADIIAAHDVDKNNFDFIDNIRKHKKVVIYGAGDKGKWVLLQLHTINIEVFAFLDRNAKNIDSIEGIPVLKADSNRFTGQERENVYILITTQKKFYKEIENDLTKLGYKNVNPYKCVWYTGDSKAELNSIANRRDDIVDCARLIEDEKSFNVYEEAISYYITGNNSEAFEPEYNNQYFPQDIPFNKGCKHFIDCGAYDGDTIDDLYKRRGTIDTLIAFEPSELMFKALVNKLQCTEVQFAQHIFIYPCGVYSKAAQHKFVSKLWTGGFISEEGTGVIQCVSLDDALVHHTPTFIKMDIEGAEYEALLGAKRTIEQNKPDLAICVYHYLADISRIPLLIHSWNLGYKFYFRAHSDFNEELVMYATCE